MNQTGIDRAMRIVHGIGKLFVVALTVAALYAGLVQWEAWQKMKDAAAQWDARRGGR